MDLVKNISIFLYLFLSPFLVCGQAYESYNLNIDNGLPSNHAYHMLSDRHGYLWIGTENGIIKYNGYDFKLFDISCGMANSDVWTLFEDKKGRIWLSSISNQLGYLYNDRYRKVYINEKSSRIYPTKMFEYGEGISFLNHKVSYRTLALFNVKNDSAFIDTIPVPPYLYSFLNYNKEIYGVRDNIIYKITGDHKVQRICVNVVNGGYRIPFNQYGFFSDNIITSNDIGLYYVSLKDTTIKKRILNIDTAPGIYLTSYDSTRMYIYTDKYIYRLNNKMQIDSDLVIQELVPSKKNGRFNVSYILESNFWGKCITTDTRGVYLNFHRPQFKPMDIDLQNYSYVGTVNDKHYWWNKRKRKLAIIGKESKIDHVLHIDSCSSTGGIFPYGKSEVLFSTVGHFYVIGEKKDIRKIMPVNCQDTNLVMGMTVTNLIAIDSTNYYVNGKGGGFNKLRDMGKYFATVNIDDNPYKDMFFDSFRHLMWLYDNQAVVAYKGEKKVLSFGIDALNVLGIRKIEKILIDPKFGNIFIKDIDKIFVFDFSTFSFREIFKNYNLQSALCFLNKNTIIVAGKFGLSFCKVIGKGVISEQVVKRNVKNLSYSYISDAQIGIKDVLLNTDKGVFSVVIPSDSELYNNKLNYSDIPYRLVTYYHDSLIDTKSGDTMVIDQNDNKLLFDIINPLGNGVVKYSYSIADLNDEWSELNSKELFLPHLKPDHYYTLSLRASDKVWRSGVTNIHLYIKPYWWQTLAGKRITYFSFFILAGLIILFIIYITRIIVIRKQTKKNLETELKGLHLALELKSIYSQINPHFIFNSLSTGLFFIKKGRMKEAYTHISAFSDLLRSYIKSTRDKYITIADEIANLRNYINLQQSRFDDKFDYEINFDGSLAIDKIKIPSLLLQPIVENAITHGLFHKEEKGHLKIEFRSGSDNREVICIIDDDGIGRRQSKIINEESSVKADSFGGDLIGELINIFNNYEQTNIEIKYVDKTPPLSGTTVILTIKNPPHEQ